MNHDDELKNLGVALKILLIGYKMEIDKIKDPKQRTGLIQEFDKAKHFMYKMSKCFDDMNCFFTAFGVNGNANENS